MVFPRSWTWGSSDASSIATECESFLAGRYGQHLRSVSRPLPSWTWLNQLSHGSADHIRSLASGDGSSLGDPERSAAERFLAGELLARSGDDPASLAALQREVLVPEELALVNRWRDPLSASQLVTRVLAGLDRYAEETRSRRHGREAA